MSAKLEKVSVLIIDDNTHMIHIVKTILRGFGIKSFFEATDAAEAFDVVRSDGPDVIIVDYQMDLLDGADFARLVRTGDDISNPYVPIIMLSAHSERKRVIAAREAGITEFCCKPVTAEDLYKKFCAIINSPRQFVKTSSYFGPDRRRHSDEAYKGPFRRKTDEGRESVDGYVNEENQAIKTVDFT
ncbi:MAG: two-component system response regulator [Robiginitomaculum sp.]|nr:MAG: two-component system response regulator [Robiginitomaculum sp.]